MNRIVLFSPHAGIWAHTFPEALLADAVRTGGAEIVYVTCGGAMSSLCVTMAARGLTADTPFPERQAVCMDCRYARDSIRGGFGFRSFDFESALTSDDHLRIETLLDEVDSTNVAAFVVDGVPVGRAGLYEFLIERKKLEVSLTAEEWQLFRPRLANVLRSFLAAQRTLDRERPSTVIVYNSLYAVNAMWRAAATQRGIVVYTIHTGLGLKDRIQRLLIGRDSTLEWWNRLIAAWPRYRDIPCEHRQLAEVTDHFLRLFRGSSVLAYSAPKSATDEDVRGRFGVHPHQKLLVASMSSYDEYVAAQAAGGVPLQSTLLFPTQLDWARALIVWASHHPERFVLLRVHPREFPNKRDGRKSEHAAALERELAVLPDNVRVNWPADNLSIYDVAENADLFLNAWSTAGREMALLGLPVVTYCPTLLQYPAELNYVGTTQATYFEAIETALRDGWSFERTRRVYRWCVLELVRGIVNISDGFDFSDEPGRSVLQRAKNLVLSIPAVRQRYDLWRRPRTLRAQRAIAELILSGRETLLDVVPDPAPVELATETAALRTEVRRLIDALYGRATVPARPGTLRQRLVEAVS